MDVKDLSKPLKSVVVIYHRLLIGIMSFITCLNDDVNEQNIHKNGLGEGQDLSSYLTHRGFVAGTNVIWTKKSQM